MRELICTRGDRQSRETEIDGVDVSTVLHCAARRQLEATCQGGGHHGLNLTLLLLFFCWGDAAMAARWGGCGARVASARAMAMVMAIKIN